MKTNIQHSTFNIQRAILAVLASLFLTVGSNVTFAQAAAPAATATDSAFKVLDAATNVVFIPFAKYDLQSHQAGFGAAALYRVSDNFWTGVRADTINGSSTTAGVQCQLQTTFQWHGFDVTPLLEASVGIGSSSLYGSAGPGLNVQLYSRDFTLSGHAMHLNVGVVGDYEHVVFNGGNSNQANIGPLINLRF